LLAQVHWISISALGWCFINRGRSKYSPLKAILAPLRVCAVAALGIQKEQMWPEVGPVMWHLPKAESSSDRMEKHAFPFFLGLKMRGLQTNSAPS
jgi:hypothetical protein